jgi:hypothetical protein
MLQHAHCGTKGGELTFVADGTNVSNARIATVDRVAAVRRDGAKDAAPSKSRD